VWHDGRSDDADRHKKHAGLREVRVRHGAAHFQEVWLGLRQSKYLDSVTDADRKDEDRDHRLDQPRAKALQGQEESTSNAVMIIAH